MKMNKIKMSVSALILSMLALPAQALPVLNGSFSNVNPPTGTPPGLGFLITAGNTTEVPNWVTSSGASILLLPNTATIPTLDPLSGDLVSVWPGCAAGSTLSNCIPNSPSFPATSPDGGNFIGVDGDYLTGTLEQTVTGLIPNQLYNVSFWQAAAQLRAEQNQTVYCCTGPTTEQWLVSLSDVPFGGTTTETHLSPLMMNKSQSFVDWNHITLTFTATNITEKLGFFAIGTPNGVPPIVLLDGVTMTAPEPEIYELLGIGLLGILALRSQQKKHN